MALLTMGKTNQFGVKEEYWVILGININLQYSFCDITMGAYTSQKAREEGAEPMNTKKVRAKFGEGGEFETYFMPNSRAIKTTNIYQLAYEYVKKKDEYFKDAVSK